MEYTTWLDKTIEHYQILRFLEQGGMASLYQARDTKLERLVCLKVMLPEGLQREDIIGRFKQEALALAKLDHPQIVRIYSSGVTPTNQPYLVIEYVPGGSLRSFLQERDPETPVSVLQALTWTKQIADALAHAHERGIVHRDLKPANIMLRDGRTPVLADFGIAVVEETTQRLTLPGHRTPGTPHYMSPEQVASQQELDGRSDLYSLGVILYELLVGRCPPTKKNDLPKARPGLAPATYAVVDTCLQHNPDKRYQNANELSQALDQAIAAERAAAILPPTQPSRKRRPWLTAVLAAAAMAMLAFGGFWLTQDQGAGTAVAATKNNLLAPRPPTATQTLIPTTILDTPTPPPTATPTPTNTPTATAVPPAPTNTTLPPVVAPAVVNCPPPTFFQTIWETRPQLGCPTAVLDSDFTFQQFNGGLMVWQKDPAPSSVYALYYEGIWSKQQDPGGPAAASCPAAEAYGSLGPIFGFGALWCDNGIWQSKLGAPTAPEQSGGNNQIQQFENGLIFTIGPAGAFVLHTNGQWEGVGDYTTPSTSPIMPEATITTTAVCLQTPALRWAEAYAVRQTQLGCPLSGERQPAIAAYQLFSNGLTVWNDSADLVYVLYYDGAYAVYDVSQAIDQEYGDNLKGSFGWLWTTNTAVQNRLGSPDSPEAAANAFIIQNFTNGIIFTFRENYDQTYILLADQAVWTTLE